VIRAAEPDIVALQEVDQRTKRSDRVAQADELGKLTGMHVVFGGNINFEDGRYGNAVLSRLPIRRHESHRLPRLDDGEQRGVLEVEIGTRAGALLVLATHLDHRRDERERLASAEAINEIISKRGNAPALLIGDLNAVPNSKVMTTFAKHWQRANEQVLPTIPVERPARQIDYVLFRPANRWKVLETHVLDEAIASDHRPLLAVLELASGEATTESE
jgi:endonuclease/exonuclease/phosphatase family metal-dependent hydrolase